MRLVLYKVINTLRDLLPKISKIQVLIRRHTQNWQSSLVWNFFTIYTLNNSEKAKYSQVKQLYIQCLYITLKNYEEIRELHKLLYLLVSFQDKDKNHVAVGAEVSPGIGHLELLQNLSLIKANKQKGNIKEDGKDLCASIEKMEHLTSLYVKSASIDEYLDLNYVDMFLQMINNLFLGGRLHNIPGWIRSLTKQFNSLLEALWDLPSLEELYMHDAYSGEVLEFGAEWFVELRILVIEQCSSLKKVVIPEPAMPKLQKLIIKNCDSLIMVRIAINTVTRLEEMVPQELICFQ
ncbi:disease resistance protein RPM1-like [Fagus crenata]